MCVSRTLLTIWQIVYLIPMPSNLVTVIHQGPTSRIPIALLLSTAFTSTQRFFLVPGVGWMIEFPAPAWLSAKQKMWQIMSLGTLNWISSGLHGTIDLFHYLTPYLGHVDLKSYHSQRHIYPLSPDRHSELSARLHLVLMFVDPHYWNSSPVWYSGCRFKSEGLLNILCSRTNPEVTLTRHQKTCPAMIYYIKDLEPEYRRCRCCWRHFFRLAWLYSLPTIVFILLTQTNEWHEIPFGTLL